MTYTKKYNPFVHYGSGFAAMLISLWMFSYFYFIKSWLYFLIYWEDIVMEDMTVQYGIMWSIVAIILVTIGKIIIFDGWTWALKLHLIQTKLKKNETR